MSTQVMTHALDEELGDLWFARDSLDEAGWARLYGIVGALLLPYRPQELASLNEEREHYVQDFFCEKVMRPDAVPARIHVGALKSFYRNFLKDQIRELSTYRKYFADVDGSDDAEGDGVGTVESCPAAQENPWGDPGLKALADEGHDIPAVRAAARRFLSDAEEWVPVYLAFSFCPDAEKREPLIHLAARLGVKSYHYKATDLGINWGHGKGGKAFGETQLGRWIERDLGISLVAKDQVLILAVFKILCFEALNWAETLEANR